MTRRWPHLVPAVSLQRRRVSRALDLSDAIDKRFPADTSSEPPRLADKLRAHVPMLAGEPVVIDSSSVRDSVLGFCDDFGTGEAGEPAGSVRY